MTWVAALDFAASIVKSVAWPFVAVLGLGLFRRPIVGLLASISKISHTDKGTEVSFARGLLDTSLSVQMVIDEAPLPSPTRQLLDERTPVVGNATQVVAAWSELEEKVRLRLTRAGIDASSMGAPVLLRTARERGLITADQSNSLSGLSALRNLAVHGRGGDLTEERTQEFLLLANTMKTVLDITSN